jgi:hypothetical protein
LKYSLIVVTVLVALLGWLKPTPTPAWVTATAALLLVLSAFIQLRVAISERRAKASSAQTGVLKSRQTLLAPKQATLPKLEIGDSGAIFAFSGPQGQPLFKFFDDSHLTVELEDGQLKVSTVIRDQTGKVVAELAKNEWKVNSATAYDRNYSKDALEVRDATGEVVMQVRFVGDRVQFQGRFFDKTGRGVTIAKVKGPDGKMGGAMDFSAQLRITPIFRYPGERHLGEFA